MKQKIASLYRIRFARFFAVGVANTGLDFLFFNILLHLTRGWHLGGWQVNVCNMISASSVTMISYELNSRYVFKPDKRLPAHYRVYFLLIVLSGIFILQNVILRITIPNAGPVVDFVQSAGSTIGLTLEDSFIRNNFGKACATVATLTWNYTLFKKYIFRAKAEPEAQ